MPALIKKTELEALRYMLISRNNRFGELHERILRQHGCTSKTHIISLSTGAI